MWTVTPHPPQLEIIAHLKIDLLLFNPQPRRGGALRAPPLPRRVSAGVLEHRIQPPDASPRASEAVCGGSAVSRYDDLPRHCTASHRPAGPHATSTGPSPTRSPPEDGAYRVSSSSPRRTWRRCSGRWTPMTGRRCSTSGSLNARLSSGPTSASWSSGRRAGTVSPPATCRHRFEGSELVRCAEQQPTGSVARSDVWSPALARRRRGASHRRLDLICLRVGGTGGRSRRSASRPNTSLKRRSGT
jgi:hypothetical protein